MKSNDFQPMPKRFMVWDKIDKKFLDDPSQVCTITRLVRPITCPDMIIVQSTNLFDKDGEEIFEGSIVDYDGDGTALGVVESIDGQWQLKDKNGNLMLLKGAPHQKLVSHILSNPELLEGV